MGTKGGKANGGRGGKRPAVFVSYAREDLRWKEELLPHIEALELDEQIEVWHDGRIDTGGKWRDKMETALQGSGVAICLVSKHFLSSKFIRREEVKYFLA